jgi:signal transduction histidine kinase
LLPLVVVALIVVGFISHFATGRGPWPLFWLVPLLWIAPFLILGFLFRFGRMRRFPVRDLVEATRRLAEGDYSVRVEALPGGPIKGLIDSFNGMAGRLQDSSEQRRRLLADLGHELRTPLTVIQGEIEAMLDGVRPRQDAELKRLLGETQLLARLLEDLRTLSLSEAGELGLEKETVAMAPLLEEAVQPFREEREIAIECDPGQVTCDPLRIRQVLTNILANAVRATRPGDTIRIRARRGEGWTVTVSDPGRGIPSSELPHIFERFARAADSGGSGLGLSIARDLVAAHGGAITARSEVGRGTDLEFTLP